MWVVFLPVALTPLWHDEQLPVVLLWSKVAPLQSLVLWQSSQVSALGM
ncbi:hypothetical protein IMCC3088_2845 [Aequoribacter fuscus]|uniref:Uncharacterized protein n=1 Tax=Aequoribacter fuscus TaxID=2518989 RepID=F3L566_9GAMM|nr:hypothetical protein IMCC3088_2845 [Aequoribacter fuscus]